MRILRNGISSQLLQRGVRYLSNGLERFYKNGDKVYLKNSSPSYQLEKAKEALDSANYSLSKRIDGTYAVLKARLDSAKSRHYNADNPNVNKFRYIQKDGTFDDMSGSASYKHLEADKDYRAATATTLGWLLSFTPIRQQWAKRCEEAKSIYEKADSGQNPTFIDASLIKEEACENYESGPKLTPGSGGMFS